MQLIKAAPTLYSKFPRWQNSTAGIRVSSFHFITKHFISKLTFLQVATFAFGSNFQKTMLQNVFQFRSPFRKYSSQLVPHSSWMNLGLTQIITVILLIATIIETCQRVSRSNLKIKEFLCHHNIDTAPRVVNFRRVFMLYTLGVV